MRRPTGDPTAAILVMLAVVAAPVATGASQSARRRVLHAVPALEAVAGTFPGDAPRNAPPDWPVGAGAWNAKAARVSAATGRLAFETHREDIRGGSIADSEIRATGVHEYFRAGPQTGDRSVSGTTVIYVASLDGSGARCIGCTEVVDGQDGVRIFKAAPNSGATPQVPQRQAGAVIWANQHKDLPYWDPSGAWLLAAVEMPVHAATHAIGKGEIGMFNDLWAVSADGLTWVQLTDFAATWTHCDPVAPMPYACADAANCPTGCQYAGAAAHPFAAYSCSAAGAPPPSSGVMRPVVSAGAAGSLPGAAKVVWAERVGLSPAYVWGGVLQLALADLVLTEGLPALVNYERNVTPAPAHPGGRELWRNPGGTTVIGAGYEPWSFSAGDELVGLASDVFLSTSNPAVTRAISPASQAFTDAIAWRWRGVAALENLTRYDAEVYAYQDNAAPPPVSRWGHWEEPIVFSPAGAGLPFIAFASSASLDPPWNPAASTATFALETWILRADRSSPAWKLTHLSEPATAPRILAYPTATAANGQLLYLTVVPANAGIDPPGSVARLLVPRL